jgi:hypothetical protein
MTSPGLKLTWSDLIIEDLPSDELAALLAPWSFVLEGRVAPIFLNKFGSWFFHRPSGCIDLLDVLTANVETVAPSHEAFVARVNERSWQEEYLLSRLVYELHGAGKIPGPNECYALAPHPALGGPNPQLGEPVQLEYVMVMSLRLWQSFCRQSLGGPP